MKKVISIIPWVVICSSLIACSGLAKNKSSIEWDFDHNVQFTLTKLESNAFQLEIIPNNKVKFKQLSAFLLRKSYALCGGYHYKIEIIQGIEGFDDKRAKPHYITPSLLAKIEC